MSFWDSIKNDASKNFSKNLKEGYDKLRIKAEELTDEGKRKLKLYDLNSKVHKQMANLGGLVYNMKDGKANPLNDPKVIVCIERIAKLEVSISKIDDTKKPAAKKKIARKKTAKKKTAAKKTAAKKKST